MTEVGHFLTGAAIGVLCKPKAATVNHKRIHLVSFVALSIIPDLQFIHWGHGQYYYFSHSLFVNLLLIVSCSLPFIISEKLRAQIGGWLVLFGGSLSWLSHLLLDSFYNHGKGVAIYWPLSDARLILPIPWFDVALGSISHIIRVALIELICYLPILLLAIWFRKKMDEHR